MTSFPMHCIHPGELNSGLKGEMVVNCQWPDANVQTLETQSNNFFSIPSPSGLEGKSIGVHQEITFFLPLIWKSFVVYIYDEVGAPASIDIFHFTDSSRVL